MTSTDKPTPSNELISLKGKRAVITGGATGLGYAIVYRLAEAGAAICIADIDSDKAREAATQLTEQGYEAHCTTCDVSNESSVKQMVEAAGKDMGGVDILVNNAGVFPRKELDQMTGQEFEKVLSINMTGTFLCSKYSSAKMIEQKKGGCIINLGSIAALHPTYKGMSAYDSSKGGVLMLTKSLALELGPHNIRVNAIAPGGMLTQAMMNATKGIPTREGLNKLKEFMHRTALGRMGYPDEIGKVALFLASDMASYITGEMIVVDGGYLIS
ncbi:MAG: SDR family oxidoreductase [Chloroflexi bacterium]|jgi:2-dehydro-3-deoxy-D-gluconate 5-dehydrogenase|nr:SDR family oxidoreductase [Chloroflexota bacterium]MBT7080320.1 SDR family oxidoreductase [Chloroflexota bacterium]MBT7289381.1 SDR family oxidoreductase [Chloroflexota bacterium]